MSLERSRRGVSWSLPRWLLAARIVHPFPTLLNALTVGGLALVATAGRVSLLTLAHLMLTMLAIQAAIGIVNDLVDLPLDAAGKRTKPLVEGALSPRTACIAALASLIAAALLALGFGPAAWLLAMAGLGCGLLYDLWLKRTRASAVPLLIALPLLPLWVWTALGRFRPELLALLPLGALLGLSLHLANSLADFELDAAGGSRGLVQWLGWRRAIALAWGAFALVLLLVAGSTAVVAYRSLVLLPGFALAALALVAAMLLYARRPSQASLRAGWGLLAAGAVAFALGWLAALPGR